MNEEPNINKLATVSLALSLLGFGSIGYLASYFVGIIDLPGIYTLSVGETLVWIAASTLINIAGIKLGSLSLSQGQPSRETSKRIVLIGRWLSILSIVLGGLLLPIVFQG